MEFFAVLITFTVLAWMLPVRFGGRSIRDAMRYALGIAFVFAGVSHFVMPEFYFVYLPDWSPVPETIIYLGGAAEIIGGLAVFTNRYRKHVGVALAVYLVLIFPGNVYAAVSGADTALPGLPDAWWYPWVRLPFQALFIWWAIYSTRSDVGNRTPEVRNFGGSIAQPATQNR